MDLVRKMVLFCCLFSFNNAMCIVGYNNTHNCILSIDNSFNFFYINKSFNNKFDGIPTCIFVTADISWGVCNRVKDSVYFRDIYNKISFEAVIKDNKIIIHHCINYFNNYVFSFDTTLTERAIFTKQYPEDSKEYSDFFVGYFMYLEKQRAFQNYLKINTKFSKSVLTNKKFVSDKEHNYGEFLKLKLIFTNSNHYVLYNDKEIVTKGTYKMIGNRVLFYDESMGLFYELLYMPKEKTFQYPSFRSEIVKIHFIEKN